MQLTMVYFHINILGNARKNAPSSSLFVVLSSQGIVLKCTVAMFFGLGQFCINIDDVLIVWKNRVAQENQYLVHLLGLY